MSHNCTVQISRGGGGIAKKAVATFELFHTVLETVAANKCQQTQLGQSAEIQKK